MKKLCSVLMLLILILTGCGQQQEEESRNYFPFPMPGGYSLIGSGSDFRDILRETDGVTVGGIRLTELTRKNIRKGTYGRYLDEVAESPTGSEYFSWSGGSRRHPIAYVNQFVTFPGEEEKREYLRVLFEQDGLVYDMWFDPLLIDRELLGELFYPLAEKNP